MASISDTARRSGNPRRTVQYWADNDILAEGEFEIARLLRPFARMGAPIGLIKVMAIYFRDRILAADGIDLALIEGARRGKEAFLVIQIAEMAGAAAEGAFGRYLPETIFVGASARGMAAALQAALVRRPALPVVALSLTEALDAQRILRTDSED